MSERDFCYWLQGFFEMTEAKELSEKQIAIVKNHLKLVFDKQTPSYSTRPTISDALGDVSTRYQYTEAKAVVC